MSETIKNYGVSTHQTDAYEIGSNLREYVDLVSGSLTVEFEDFAWGGLRLPITLKHFYHSDLGGIQYSNNPSLPLNVANFSAMKLGNGWRLNFMQSIVQTEEGYLFTDENGNTTKLLPTENADIFKDEEGNLIYTPSSLTLLSDNNNYIFDNKGRLIEIEDKYKNKILINYSNDRISEIQDGAGRSFTFAYNSAGYLLSITAPDESVISYQYDDGFLERIVYPDGKTIVFGCDNNKITCTVLLDSDTLDAKELHEIYCEYTNKKISTVTESGSENGHLIEGITKEYTFSSTGKCTSVLTHCADEETTKTEYTFDENGEVVNTYTHTVEFVEENGTTVAKVKVSEDVAVQNLLHNHSFENGVTGWSAINETSQGFDFFNSESKYCYIGKSAVCFNGDNIPSNEPQGVYQQTETLSAGEYTLSAYMRTNAPNQTDSPIGFIRVRDISGNVLAVSEVVDKYDTSYYRLTATFKLESDIAVNAELLMYGTGYVYADAIQLEKGNIANDYNMLENSDFGRDTADWSNTNFSTEHYFSGKRSLKLTAPGGAHQIVNCNSESGTRETFTLSGWVKAPDILTLSQTQYDFHIRVDMDYLGGNEQSGESATYYFSTDTNDWQYFELQFSKKNFKPIEKMTVYCTYVNCPGSAYFDNLCLVRNSIETGLNSSDFEEEETYSTDVASEGQSGTPVPTSESSNTAEVEEDSFVEDTAPTFEEALDKAGNPLTQTTFNDGEFGTIYRSFGYDSAKNNLISETDSLGNSTKYEVNELTSKNEVVTDRLGNKTAYEYDTIGRTTKVTSKRSDDTEISNVSYNYDEFDNLTEIARGDGMNYTLKYNHFHELESIGIDGETKNLINYTYKNAGGKIKEISYANGDKMTATYNGKGELIAEKWYNLSNTLIAHYKYTYDDKGNMLRSIDIFALKEYNYTYEDDKITRATEYDITLSEEQIVTSKIAVNTIRYFYNDDGDLTCKRVFPSGGEEQVIYFEKNENQAEILKSEIAHQKYLSHSKTDNFGRKIFEEIQFGSGFVSRKFEYQKGEITEQHIKNDKIKSTPETPLISKITLSSGRVLEYSYDAEERITRVKDSKNGTTFYTYDALGQLLTETVNDTVKTAMVYDNYGNIRIKNGIEYIYDSIWKDKLVRVGDKIISYDAQGNPTNYLGHNLSWEKGRQLKSFDYNTYSYNANGIRTSKYIKATDAVHKYILDGTKILRESWTEHYTSMGNVVSTDYYIEPIYDNEDSVAGINFCGDVYFFNKNLQGDIIEIIDAYNGKTVAKYSYDAWGKCTVDSDSVDTLIAERNPFRYRGYYYDSEIGLYYVSSRYYDPEIGRFLNSDDASYAINQLGSTEHNLYAYCSNDPVNSVDIGGFFTIKIYAIAAVTAAVISAVAKVVANYAKGYRGWKLFRGVLGASIGSAVNVVLLMKLIKWKKKGLLLAALAGAAVQSVFDFAEGVLIDKKYKWKQLTFDFILNFASTLIGNYIGYKSIYINGYWFQPQKAVSFFTKSYGKRLIAQTGIGAVISLLIDLIRTGLEKLSKK